MSKMHTHAHIHTHMTVFSNLYSATSVVIWNEHPISPTGLSQVKRGLSSP